jgi:hypothetical protein
MGDVRVIPTADAPPGSLAFQHNDQLFVKERGAVFRIFVVKV